MHNCIIFMKLNYMKKKWVYTPDKHNTQTAAITGRTAYMDDNTHIEALIEALGQNVIAVRMKAKLELLQYGPALIDRLVEVVRTGNRFQAYEAASILAGYSDKRCFAVLAESICSLNLMLAQLAVRTLGSYGNDKAFGPWITSLPDAPLMTQTQILEMLKDARDKRAIQPLMDLLKTASSPVLRYSIIEALSLLDATEAIDLIRCFKDDENHHVRDRVSAALEHLQDLRDAKGSSWATAS